MLEIDLRGDDLYYLVSIDKVSDLVVGGFRDFDPLALLTGNELTRCRGLETGMISHESSVTLCAIY